MNLTINLTQGKIAIISEVDIDLTILKWYYDVKYAKRSLNPGCEFLHRVIAERNINRTLTEFEFVDHINLNKLDNTRQNLRVVNRSQNGANRNILSNNKSGFKGVSFHKKTGKWQADIASGILHQKQYIGLFNTPEEAAKAYDIEAKKKYGEFAKLNYV